MGGRASAGRGPLRELHIYSDLAKWYDAQYDWKDYPAEVRRLETLARRFARSGHASWLDVACGTGKHLELLSGRFDCAGVDASPQMLRVARRRLPGIPLVRGDMRSFDLGRQFGVVSCLFSAVGHLASEADLQRALTRMAAHVRPGGLLIVEPWVSPKDFHPGSVHLRTYEDPLVTLVRCAYSRRRGNESIIEYSYLIGEPGKGVRYVRETDRGLLVAPGRFYELLRKAGLRPRYLRRGFTSKRGLYLGMKPAMDRSAATTKVSSHFKPRE